MFAIVAALITLVCVLLFVRFHVARLACRWWRNRRLARLSENFATAIELECYVAADDYARDWLSAAQAQGLAQHSLGASKPSPSS